MYLIDFDVAFIQIERWGIGMDEIEVIKTIEELRKFLNDKNFMEIVIRQKNKRFKKFYKVALDNIFKEAEQQQAA